MRRDRTKATQFCDHNGNLRRALINVEINNGFIFAVNNNSQSRFHYFMYFTLTYMIKLHYCTECTPYTTSILSSSSLVYLIESTLEGFH